MPRPHNQLPVPDPDPDGEGGSDAETAFSHPANAHLLHPASYTRLLEKHPPGDRLYRLARAILDTALDLNALEVDHVLRTTQGPRTTETGQPNESCSATPQPGTCCAHTVGMHRITRTALTRLWLCSREPVLAHFPWSMHSE